MTGGQREAPASSSKTTDPCSLLDEVRAALHLVARAPRHDWDRGGRVLRRAFDEPVGIDHVDQHVALDVAAAHDLHLLEEQRAALAKNVLALLELGLDADRPDLPTGERDVRHLLGDADPAPARPRRRGRQNDAWFGLHFRRAISYVEVKSGN